MKHWRETAEIIGRLLQLASVGRRAALATVVHIAGSSYRRPGATFLVEDAVVDALAHLGVRHIDIPITPEKVWNILREKGVAE